MLRLCRVFVVLGCTIGRKQEGTNYHRPEPPCVQGAGKWVSKGLSYYFQNRWLGDPWPSPLCCLRGVIESFFPINGGNRGGVDKISRVDEGILVLRLSRWLRNVRGGYDRTWHSNIQWTIAIRKTLFLERQFSVYTAYFKIGFTTTGEFFLLQRCSWKQIHNIPLASRKNNNQRVSPTKASPTRISLKLEMGQTRRRSSHILNDCNIYHPPLFLEPQVVTRVLCLSISRSHKKGRELFLSWTRAANMMECHDDQMQFAVGSNCTITHQ